MCRLVGIVASEVTEFGLVLREAPRSLARLSSQHPDGWGVAAHGGPNSIPPPPTEASRHEYGWRIHKGTERASECPRFHALAGRSAGIVLIAHIRQKTVGATKLENTHPFAKDGWVFAHNGTVKDQDFVRRRISEARLAEIRGDTDSEALFAFILTRFDEAGVTRDGSWSRVRETATRVLDETTAELRARKVGAFNFLLSNGASSFVHRHGRSLFLLERGQHRSGESGTSLSGPPSSSPASSCRRRRAVFVASERLTDEPWTELVDGTLLRVDRDPSPQIGWTCAPERVAS